MPLVAPATSWPLDAWISNFWSLANSAGLRIEESGFHWYSYPLADTLIGNVQSVYNAWGRPIWITEFSTSNPGTYYTEEMNYNFLAEFMWRAEPLACLHRYGIFCFSEAEPTNTWDQSSPNGAVFLSDGATLTPFGQLYAAWDADLSLHTNIPYILHNKGAYYRMNNTGASAPAIANIRTNDLTAQWRLVPSPTANQYYIASLSDGRCLSYSGSALSLAAAGTTGTAAQWSYTAYTNGYFYIDNPAANMRLGINRVNGGSGQPTTTNLAMYAAGTASDATRWRLFKPYKPAPLGLTALPGNGQAALSWSAVSGALSYNLKRAIVSGGPYTTIATGLTATTYTNTGLTNNLAYYYAVSSVLATGESANSAEATVIPGGVAVNCGSSSPALWFRADNSYSGGSSSSTSSTIDTSGLTNPAPQAVYQCNRWGSMTYTITNLTANTYYWVRLHFAENYWGAAGSRVFNVIVNGTTMLSAFDIYAAAGAQNRAVIRDLYKQANSSGQMVIQFTAVSDNPQINGIEVLQSSPLVPAGLWAAAGNGQVTLTWAACGGAASYNVYRATTSGGPYTLISTTGSVTETGYIDSAVANGTTYYYVLSASNSYNESGKSSEASATPYCTPPPAPTAGNNSPLFAGMTLNLTASTVPGASYSWSGPNGYVAAAQNPSIARAGTNAAGLYSVTATVNGCSSVSVGTMVTVNPPVSLTVQAAGSGLTLVWPGGTLQCATNVTGPWNDLDGVSSPYSNAPEGPQEFYRVKVQ